MNNVLIINAHHYYPFSEGKLNAALVEKAAGLLTAKGYQTRTIAVTENNDVDAQLANFQWADTVILQVPSNWMGVPWTFKKYMDEVFTAGMGGALCFGDGRNAAEPTKSYGTGGTLTGKKYMLSLTFNAPAQAFEDNAEFFAGNSVDDLMLPMHMNFKFFDMQPMPTFSCFDVMKNADVATDFKRFEAHLNQCF